MILSGIPQALAAAQTMKICDFPGNKNRLKGSFSPRIPDRSDFSSD